MISRLSLLIVFASACFSTLAQTKEFDRNRDFGASVSISNKLLVIGAPNENTTLNGKVKHEAGALYLHVKNSMGQWKVKKRIVSPEPTGHGNFGAELAHNTSFLAVAETGADSKLKKASDAGIVYIYKIDEGKNLMLSQEIMAPDHAKFDNFGLTLKMTDDKLLIGSHRSSLDVHGIDPIKEAGAVYIYSLVDGKWEFEQKLCASSRSKSSHFGNTVDIQGDNIAIGAYSHDNVDKDGLLTTNSGRVYVFTKGEGGYVESAALDSPLPSHGGLFGYSCLFLGDRLFVGSPGEPFAADFEDYIEESGAVFSFKLEKNQWQLEKLIEPILRHESAFFGFALAGKDDVLLVTSIDYRDEPASGEPQESDHVYSIPLDEEFPHSNQTFMSEWRSISGTFTSPLKMSGYEFVLGAPADDRDGAGEGALFVFDLVDTSHTSIGAAH